MPVKSLGSRTLDARQDRPDLRDRLYSPRLTVLPPSYPPQKWIATHLPRYEKAGLILDQGEEGACTGFGLAALINYVAFRYQIEAAQRGSGRPKAQPVVSPRMLYHLARIYDEWPGEDYEGSSCRGGMKGWFHHGICSDAFWPYRKNGKVVFVPPKDGWTADAATRPLGAYYRITHDAIADLQAAIVEVGAIYVSANVHAGWQDPSNPAAAGRKRSRKGARTAPSVRGLPTIPWTPKTKPDGGHAFALVGYDDEGFVVQNSWGPDWGFHGFARMTYGDWLANGMDAWVGTLGAPIKGEAPTIVLTTTVPEKSAELQRGLAAGVTATAVATAADGRVWDLARAARHSLVLGNDGRLASQILVDAADAADAATRVTKTFPSQWLADPKTKSKKLVLYVHGGLNDLRAALARVKVLGPCFFDNEAYPIFACWQSGFLDSLKNALTDLVSGIFGDDPRMQQAQGFFDDAKDRALETFAIPAGRPIWQQMKQNALAASRDGGGIAFLADRLGEVAKTHKGIELHLVGHSAGAIVIAPLLDLLRDRGVAVGSLSLYAPACTVDLANEFYGRHIGKTVPVDKVAIEVLSDAREREDTVGPYGKSLLYLVSRALENAHKTPILGLEAVFNPALDGMDILASASPPRGLAITAAAAAKPLPAVADWRRLWAAAKGADERVLAEPQVFDGVRSIPAQHGCFDNWQLCIARTIERIRGAALKEPLLPLIDF